MATITTVARTAHRHKVQ